MVTVELLITEPATGIAGWMQNTGAQVLRISSQVELLW